jgi:TonB family protein
LNVIEATVAKRGARWTLVGWNPVAGPEPKRAWVLPGIEGFRELRHDAPIYPRSALEANLSALVIAEARVDVRGKVSSVEILRGHPLFDEAVAEALKKWEYAPFLVGGVPVSLVIRLTFAFAVHPGGRTGGVSVEQFYTGLLLDSSQPSP